MKIFIDSANLEEIKKTLETGLVDGITTNPSLIAKMGGNVHTTIAQICEATPGPVSVEVLATDTPKMILEGRMLSKLASNVVVKLPLTIDGLKACEKLSSEDIEVNITLCFSATQALLAAKAGAAYISPFIGRLDDVSSSGLKLLEEIATIYNNYHFETEILAASLRHPQHVLESALVGADIATIPANVFWQLFEHPLTEKGLNIFLDDAQKSKQVI
jgi:transaldolase